MSIMSNYRVQEEVSKELRAQKEQVGARLENYNTEDPEYKILNELHDSIHIAFCGFLDLMKDSE